MNKFSSQKLSIALVVALLINVASPLFLAVTQAHAAPLTEASIRFTRMSATVVSSASNPILIILKPATTIATGSSPKVRVTWPTSSAFTVSGTAANHDTNTTCVPSTYQGESVDTLTITNNEASAVSGGAVTYDVGEDLTSGTLYGFCTFGGVTNPTSPNAGTHLVTIETLANTTPTDSRETAVDITATNADQVTLYATVSATFNFAISANTLNMQALSPSDTSQASITADVDTNANNGWIAWIRSEGGAATLASASTGDAINSTDPGGEGTAEDVATSPGSEGYVVDVSTTAGTGGGGSLTTSNEYDGGDDNTSNTSSTAGGVITTTYEPIAQRTGPVDSDIITLTAVVTISAVNEAATDYTDTWELTAAGNF